jgi:hypothetical protein
MHHERHAVATAVHPHSRAVGEEELGLLAGSQLGAVHASAALIRTALVLGGFLVEQLRGHGLFAVVGEFLLLLARLVRIPGLLGDHSDHEGDEQLSHWVLPSRRVSSAIKISASTN